MAQILALKGGGLGEYVLHGRRGCFVRVGRYPLIDWNTGKSPRARASIGALMETPMAWAVASSMSPFVSGYRMVRACARSKSCFDQSAASRTHPTFFAACRTSDLIVDVAVGDGHVRQHEIGEIKPLDHLGDDERAGVLIGAHRLVAERQNGRGESAVP